MAISTRTTVDAVLEEAGRFASDVIAPLNRVGDKFGTPFKDGEVTTPPGWKEAYTAWAAAGWNGLAAPADFGGQELPHALNAACIEMWNSASMAFGIGPVLTMAAVDALACLRHRRPQAALSRQAHQRRMDGHHAAHRAAGRLRRRRAAHARPSARPTAAIASPARRSSSPTASTISPTTSSISCWRGCPMRRPAPKASRCSWCRNSWPDGTRNDVRAHSVEHKLGIHASPTCTMVYGDKGGAIGFLIGEEHKGMACMFTMMNRARLAVGLQGVAIAERATQQALAYARERKQSGPRHHRLSGRQAHAADHARAHRRRARDLLRHRASRSIARSAARPRPRARRRMSAPRCSRRSRKPSPPISASKSPRSACRCMAAWASSRRPAPRSITATPASPRSTKAPTASRPSTWWRARCRSTAARRSRLYLDELRETVTAVKASNAPAFGETAARLGEAIDSLERATQWLLAQKIVRRRARRRHALSAAVRQCRRRLHAGRPGARGACATAAMAPARTALARFFAENIAVQASGLERSVTEGADSITGAQAALAE